MYVDVHIDYIYILPIRFSNAPRHVTRASSLISDYVQHSIESSALPGTRGVGSSRHAAQILIYSSVGSTTDASTLHHLLPGFLKRACVFRRATLASPGFKSGSDVACVLTRTCACERVGREKERRARCADPERSGHAGHQCAGVRLLFPASYDGGPLGAAPGRVPCARGGSGAGHSPVLVSLGTARHRAVGVCGSEKWEGGLPVAVLLGSAPGLEVSALGYDCIRRA